MATLAERLIFERKVLGRSIHIGSLFGQVDNFTLDQSLNLLENYTDALRLGAFFNGLVNPIPGQIIIPVLGDYKLTGTIIGDQGDTKQGEAIELHLRIGNAGPLNGDFIIGSIDISTPQTCKRHVMCVFNSPLPKNATLELRMRVTGNQDFGIFTFIRVLFEVEFLALIS